MADFSNSNVDSVCGRDITSETYDEGESYVRFIVVGQNCRQHEKLAKALKIHGYPVEYSDTGLEYLNECDDYDTIFILNNFESDLFLRLHRAGARIMGPPVVIKTAENDERLPNNSRPLYCCMMRHLILCFTGFKVKDELARLAELVHHMGGSIRKDFSSKVTHLVANCSGGQKYRVAVSLGTPIMTEEWVHHCWEERDNTIAMATDELLIQYQPSPFSFATLSFYGFSRDEQRHMEELAVSNGGTCAEPGAPTCTHLVVDEHTVKMLNLEVHSKLHVVKSEWFWASIQIDACADEHIYKFEEIQGTPNNVRPGRTTPKTLSGNKSRKRKRLRENLAQLAAEGDVDSPMCLTKRRSNEIARMSFSASFLDATADTSGKENESHMSSPPAPPKMSSRQLTVMELLQTERNYVGIINTILRVFRDEIERADQPGGPLLDATDVKQIFGYIPAIYDVHLKIRDELEEIVKNWSETQLIGQVFLNHAEALMKAYPPFVNFFEKTKETIAQCDKTKPRFHAFLKVCQSKAECGRQTLQELLIRPVQRLPSILLLLKDILKRTDRSQEDHNRVENAMANLEEVMTHINEDKRKAEGHQMMFDIVNDIDNCPPNLLSSHRSFVMKVDVIELTETLSSRGENASLFVFTDSLEMCKRRVKVLNSKSPAAHGAKTPQKAYKHIEMLPLNCIKRVLDIKETKDCKNVFGLVTKEMYKKEKLFAFLLVDEERSDKTEFLKMLSKLICTSTCRTDYENLMASKEAQDLEIDTSDIQNRTLSKAATKFGKRVSRAFSFNKTPRKLKRAMSSMSQVMSPFRRESMSFIAPNGTTPLGDLRGMRLASTNDLTGTSPRSDLAGMRFASTNDLTTSELSVCEELADSFAAIPEHFTTPKIHRKRRESVGAPIYATLRRQFSKQKLIPKRFPDPLTPSIKWYRAGVTPSIKELASPLQSCPSTPNLTNQFSRSATIGHSGLKML